MPEQALDLWAPDIGTTEVQTPAAILRRQAALLSEKTNRLLEGAVTTTADEDGFRVSFYVVSPALDNYKYQLFRIRHGIQLYPVTVETVSPAIRLDSEEEFVDWLRRVLSSKETRRIITSLISQSKS